jgi:hypothetical protein
LKYFANCTYLSLAKYKVTGQGFRYLTECEELNLKSCSSITNEDEGRPVKWGLKYLGKDVWQP